MTKLELIKEIAKKTGIGRGYVELIVEEFMKSVEQSAIKGKPINLRGFGSFIVKKRAAKMGRIISKNVSIQIPERFIPTFKPSKRFTRLVK